MNPLDRHHWDAPLASRWPACWSLISMCSPRSFIEAGDRVHPVMATCGDPVEPAASSRATGIAISAAWFQVVWLSWACPRIDDFATSAAGLQSVGLKE